MIIGIPLLDRNLPSHQKESDKIDSDTRSPTETGEAPQAEDGEEHEEGEGRGARSACCWAMSGEQGKPYR